MDTPQSETRPVVQSGKTRSELSFDGPTRVAIIGAGFIADFHLEILAPLADVEVVCICDPARERADALAKKWGVPNVATDITELESHAVQVAHLLVPPDLHADLCRKLLELGIGVFCEKPFTLTVKEARELETLAGERGLPLGVNHNNLFHPAFEEALELVRSGDIGRVEHVQVTLSVPLMQLDAEDYAHWMFRTPRNIVFEQAPHPLCQVHALIGRPLEVETQILGTRELLPGRPFHDRWAVSARGERGTAEIYLAFGQGFTANTVRILCSDGSAEADIFHNHFTYEKKTKWLDFWNSFLAGRGRHKGYRRSALRVLFHYLRFTLGFGRREDAFFAGMRESLSRFHATLRAGEALPVDGGSAAEVIEWCEAVASPASSKSAAPIKWTEDVPARDGEVCVFGANGFIGRRVVSALRERGTPVTCITRRNHALPSVIEDGVNAGELRLLRASLDDEEAMRNAFRGARAVIHLATGGGDTWEEVEHSMVQGSVRAAEAALAEGVERFVYVSSVAALYTGPDAPRDLPDSNATDPRPEERAVYARGKIEAEKALLKLAREKGLPLIIARPGVVVGAGTPMQHSGIGLWARDNHCVGWGIGDHHLPLVLADDVAEGLVRAALHTNSDLDGKALNLCAQVPLSAQDMVSELKAASGRALVFHPRPLERSQLMEVGKWLVKLAGGRKAPFPSWHDLKARALVPSFRCDLARDVLGWQPVEEREAFLERAAQIYAPEPAPGRKGQGAT